MSEYRMQRKDGWPEHGDPIGKYQIHEVNGDRRIVYVCTRGRVCDVPINDASPLPNGAGPWHWDQASETLTPSINCEHCSHFTITNGVMRDA